MSDLFLAPFDFIDKVFAIAALCPQHELLFLTKRIERELEYFGGGDNYNNHIRYSKIAGAASKISGISALGVQNPLPNVHLGYSVSTQKDADKGIPILLQIPAAKRFVSFEPLLGNIDLDRWMLFDKCVGPKGCGHVGPADDFVNPKKDGAYRCPKCGKNHTYEVLGMDDFIDYIIIGAESKGGHPGRECKVEWVRSLVNQAQAAGVKVHIKQLHLCGTNWDNQRFETAEEAKLFLKTDKVRWYLVKDIEQFPPDLRLREE